MRVPLNDWVRAVAGPGPDGADAALNRMLIADGTVQLSAEHLHYAVRALRLAPQQMEVIR